MIRRHEDIRDEIFIDGLHALDASAAAVLAAEVVRAHALDISEIRHGDDDIVIRDQILGFEFIVHAETRAAVIAVLVGDHIDLVADHTQQLLLVGKNALVVGDLFLEILVLRLQLTPFQTGQGAETHVDDRLGLGIGKSEGCHQLLLRDGHRLAGADDADDLFNVIKGDQQAFQNMGPFLCLVQVIFCAAGDHILLMLQVQIQHLQKIQDLRLVIDQCQHDYAEGIFHLRMLQKMIQDNLRIYVLPELNDDPHALAVGFVPEIRDAINPLLFVKISDLLNEPCLVHEIGKLRHDDAVLSVRHGLDICHRTDLDLSASGAVGFRDSLSAEDHGSRRKIRSLYDLADIVQSRLPVLDPVVNDLVNSADNLPQIVGRNVGRHADGDSGGSVHQKVRESAGKHCRFFLRLIKVRCKVHRILVDVGEHLHGDLAETGLGITHGRSAVTVHRTEVSVAVHQRIAEIPLLCHVDQGAVDGGITMRMIFTHRIADDTGALSVRLVGSVVQLDHGIKDPPLNRLQTIPDIRQRTGGNDAHGIVDVGLLHGLFQIHFLNFIENVRFHSSSPD